MRRDACPLRPQGFLGDLHQDFLTLLQQFSNLHRLIVAGARRLVTRDPLGTDTAPAKSAPTPATSARSEARPLARLTQRVGALSTLYRSFLSFCRGVPGSRRSSFHRLFGRDLIGNSGRLFVGLHLTLARIPLAGRSESWLRRRRWAGELGYIACLVFSVFGCRLKRDSAGAARRYWHSLLT